MRTDRNRLIDLRRGLDLRDRFGPAQTQRQLVRVFDGGSIPTDVPKVYLTNPAVADADDTEGASYSTVDDTGVTIPVVVLGPRVPVAGDLLVAHAIGGRWVAGDDTDTHAGPGCLTCSPCPIPKVDLAVSFHHIIFGDQTGTIVYGGGSVWGSTITFGSPPTGLTVDFECFATGFFLHLHGGLADCLYPWVSTSAAMYLLAYTCNPFHAEFKFHNASPLTDCSGQFSGSFFIDDPGSPLTTCP